VISAPAEPSPALVGRILSQVDRERGARRNRRSRRVAAGVSAFVAAAAAVIAVVLFVGTGDSSPGTQVVMPGSNGATASATLHPASSGTEIDMTVAGLKPGHYYWLWLTGEDHDRLGAGTFKGTRGESELRLMAALPLDEAERIWVTDEDKQVVLDAHLPA
jgi:hypothetical protein